MKKSATILIMILFSIFISSCGSSQKLAEQRERMARDIEGYELPVKPTNSTSVVYITRPDVSFGNGVIFTIAVDDNKEKLLNGSVVAYILKPGSHNLFVAAENKNLIPFQTEAGQVYFYEVTVRMGWLGARANTHVVDGVFGTYQVKQLYNARSTAVVNLTGENPDQEVNQKVAGTGKTELERLTIHWNINTRPQGADCYWRVKSSTPDVKNQNEKYLAPTPYESTETYDIKGLSRDNAGDVQVEIRCSKPGYNDQKKVFNMRSVIDEKEISIMMPLVKEE